MCDCNGRFGVEGGGGGHVDETGSSIGDDRLALDDCGDCISFVVRRIGVGIGFRG